MNDIPRQKLKEIIANEGESLCTNGMRCKAFLKNLCGEYNRSYAVGFRA